MSEGSGRYARWIAGREGLIVRAEPPVEPEPVLEPEGDREPMLLESERLGDRRP
ncbi:hypothetical protein QCN29_00970 [Streptomyces sp. HNM0663]|uniref:Uncharacterized protein n=1 Tax=Streptomyces chengmaiensis TaxID=3040919 RepID=A0ABT6HGL7_9ACTN|nr:hypothetical protein [Streptomyces chengmaiensis]MDH2387378.1 hypothetical protein [Streptomyces chengmaiensis]